MYAGQGKAGSVTTPEYMFSLTSSLLAQAEMDAQSSSQHIKQLAEIDKDVVKLLQSAGLAVKALTTSSSDTEDERLETAAFTDRKEAFKTAASQYFQTLSSLDVRLRQEINALKEADILPSESKYSNTATSNAQAPIANIAAMQQGANRQGVPRRGVITGGGLGSLDIGWLNSRNNNVGKEMEAELWEEAQRRVEKLIPPITTADRETDGGSTNPQSSTDKMDES